MAYGFSEMLEGVVQARKNFLKHIDGVTDDQFVWKPYPECKSIAETVDHLNWSDKATIEIMESGQEPDYSTAPTGPPTKSRQQLLGDIAQSHDALIAYLGRKFEGAALDMPVTYYSMPMTVGAMLCYMGAEESYHSGQCGYIRMATDPSWDYYAAIYGG